jgi:hypothetical protein
MLINRHRQRYGGYLVHLGLIVLAVGVVGSNFFQTEQDMSLGLGQSASVAGYTITYRGISGTMQNAVQVIETHFTVAHDGRPVAQVYPGERIFPGFQDQPTSIVSITTFGLTDFYVFLSGYEGASSAQLKVFINPLVPLVWLGGILMLLGGIVCCARSPGGTQARQRRLKTGLPRGSRQWPLQAGSRQQPAGARRRGSLQLAPGPVCRERRCEHELRSQRYALGESTFTQALQLGGSGAHSAGGGYLDRYRCPQLPAEDAGSTHHGRRPPATVPGLPWRIGSRRAFAAGAGNALPHP